jgi:hypothetical protein
MLCRLEMLLAEKLNMVNKLGAASKGFAATQMRTDAYRQVSRGLPQTHYLCMPDIEIMDLFQSVLCLTEEDFPKAEGLRTE